MIDNSKKQCLKCKIIKDINSFGKYQNTCNGCKAQRAKELYYQNKEQVLQKQKDKYHNGYKQYFQEYNEKAEWIVVPFTDLDE